MILVVEAEYCNGEASNLLVQVLLVRYSINRNHQILYSLN